MPSNDTTMIDGATSMYSDQSDVAKPASASSTSLSYLLYSYIRNHDVAWGVVYMFFPVK